MIPINHSHNLSAFACDPNGPRAKLDVALQNVAQWSDQDRHFFVTTFTSNRPEPELARTLGLSTDGYQTRRRELMRRFMRSVQLGPSAQPSATFA